MKRYPFGAYILDIPDDHKISQIHQVDTLYDRGFGFILKAIHTAVPDGVFIDIGANVGDTAATFLTHCYGNPILCIEGSDVFYPYLKANHRFLGPSVTIVNKFLRPTVFGSTPLQYQEEAGTGYLSVKDGTKPAVAVTQFISFDELLSLSANLSSSIALFKTDTDGLDGYIVLEALDRIDCPLFFECDPNLVLPELDSPWPKSFDELERRGYSVLVFDNHGLPMLVLENVRANILTDLTGYASLQRAIQPIRTHYFDIWAFPPNWHDCFEEAAKLLRGDLLKPYRF